MNIADLVERGNPNEWDDEFGPIEGSEAPNEENKGHQKPENGPIKGLNQKNVIIIAVLVLTSSACFGVGILAGQGGANSANGGGLLVGAIPTTQKASALLTASALNSNTSLNSGTSSVPVGGEVVGTSDTHTYYLPWCPQASKISKANTVWFASEEMAKAAGYTAGICPGQ